MIAKRYSIEELKEIIVPIEQAELKVSNLKNKLNMSVRRLLNLYFM